MIKYNIELKNSRYVGKFSYEEEDFPVNTGEIERFGRFLLEWGNYPAPSKDEIDLFRVMIAANFNE